MAVADSRGKLLSALDRFFTDSVALAPGAKLLVAFSGGPDSTALLWGLEQLSRERDVQLEAVHVDHRLDNRSERRADLAEQICRGWHVPLTRVERIVSPERLRRRGREAAAREVRYEALEATRSACGAEHIATAHQLDDQIETVCMRLLQGSGWEGLAGIPPVNGRIVRPVLTLRRAALREVVAGSPTASDPANRDLRLVRNRVRDELRPYVEGRLPDFPAACLRLARAAGGARTAVEARLVDWLSPQVEAGGASIDRAALEDLPLSLLASAMALLHRTAGVGYPPSRRATAELARQMRLGLRVDSDCGEGWCWQASRERLHLLRRPESTPDFTYTLEVPGAVEVAEVALRVRIGEATVESWMFRGAPNRVGLGGDLTDAGKVVVRNRRPGDRLQPLGCDYSRRLKEVLIDRQVPRAERDRIPLLCVGERIAWVPGVTIDEAFRVREGEPAWVAELQPV